MSDIEDRVLDNLALSDAQVMEYLQQNPDFFIRNARNVEQMQIPHPVRGAVSLVEWQLNRQRQHIFNLEEEITLLMEQASANELLFNRLLELQGHLAGAESLADFLQRFNRWARSLGLAGANIRLFSDKWYLNAPSDFAHLALSRNEFEMMRIQRLGNQNHYLGTLNGPELLLVLPQAKMVGSVALSLMGEFGDLGLIIFSSRDSHHYQQGQGTVLLDQLALLMPGLISRWIERQ